MIRDEVRQALTRWREVIVAGLAWLVGLWLFRLGGWLLQGVGGATVIAASGWIVVAWRRARFRFGPAGAGLVEIDEGQIAYFGPAAGGFVAVADLTGIRLAAGGRRLFLVGGGRSLSIPLAATGAEQLLDAFAALPGIDLSALARTAAQGGPDRVLWR